MLETQEYKEKRKKGYLTRIARNYIPQLFLAAEFTGFDIYFKSIPDDYNTVELYSTTKKDHGKFWKQFREIKG